MYNICFNGGSLGDINNFIFNMFVYRDFYNNDILWYIYKPDEISPDKIESQITKKDSFKNKYLILSDTETYKIYQYLHNKTTNEDIIILSHKEGYKTLEYSNKIKEKQANYLIQEYKSHIYKEINYIENNNFTTYKPDNIINTYVFSINPNYTIKLKYEKLSKEIVHTLNTDHSNYDLYRNNKTNKVNIICYNDNREKINFEIINNNILSILLFSPSAIHEIIMHILDNLIYININNIVNILKIKYKDKYNKTINDKSYIKYIDKFGCDTFRFFQNNILNYNDYSKIIKPIKDILINYEFGVLVSNDKNLMEYFCEWHNEQLIILTKLFVDMFVPEFIICYNYKIKSNINIKDYDFILNVNINYTYNTINKNNYKTIDKLNINTFYINNIIKQLDNNKLEPIIKKVSIDIFKELYKELVNISVYKDNRYYINELSYD